MAAVTVVQCEDEKGNKSFQMACPPGSKQVNTRRVATGAADATASAGQGTGSLSATLYYAPNCESCEVVKEYLRNRNIQITEKNVYENTDLQKELTDLTGKQSVPVTVIGQKVLTGYDRTELNAALAAVGYKEAKTEIKPETETNPETEKAATE